MLQNRGGCYFSLHGGAELHVSVHTAPVFAGCTLHQAATV